LVAGTFSGQRTAWLPESVRLIAWQTLCRFTTSGAPDGLPDTGKANHDKWGESRQAGVVHGGLRADHADARRSSDTA